MQRKTAYDLVAVQKGERLVNMDSQAPNQVAHEWLAKKELFKDLKLLQPEKKYKNSRFDFYIENGDDKIFMEVKGVTLEEQDKVSFPDAPSERAVKHLKELMEAIKEGYKAYVLFVVQMKNVDYFQPNQIKHPAFAQTLREAQLAGVEILAYDCNVTTDSLQIANPVPIITGGMKEMVPPLLSWYDQKRRILPWRENPEPYRVWVSEIMLQQTRVEAVKPYFERFMKELPTIYDLADAKEDVILKLWEGLGYYNRVRNLQKGAQTVVEAYQGEIPSDYHELMKISGIGSYTAGAISSFAFGQQAPAVDGNVQRVLSRLEMIGEDISATSTKRKMEERIMQLIPSARPGDFNQAMIEIGATVCVPNGLPRCQECPLSPWCQGHQQGRELEFPQKAEKKKRTIEEKTILIIRDGYKAALRKRPNKGLLAGMYEFPTLEGNKTEDEVLSYCKSIGLNPIRIQKIDSAKHIFSHKEWHMIGYSIRVDELNPIVNVNKDWLFMEPEQTQEHYPIPTAFETYTRYLNIRLGNDKFIEE